MPIVNITLLEGRSSEQKQKLFTEVTQAIQRSISAPPETIRIILNEVDPRHFAVAGEPKSSD